MKYWELKHGLKNEEWAHHKEVSSVYLKLQIKKISFSVSNITISAPVRTGRILGLKNLCLFLDPSLSFAQQKINSYLMYFTASKEYLINFSLNSSHSDMNLLHIVVILQFIFQVYGQNLVCQKEVWLPSDGSHYVSPGCEEYDGSLVPDCNYFLNNLTSYFHVHEYGRILYLEGDK